jgi:hypothetical protein
MIGRSEAERRKPTMFSRNIIDLPLISQSAAGHPSQVQGVRPATGLPGLYSGDVAGLVGTLLRWRGRL